MLGKTRNIRVALCLSYFLKAGVLCAGAGNTLAVTPFRLIGHFDNPEIYSHGIPEAVAQSIVRGQNITIVDRLHLSTVLQEISLSQTGLTVEEHSEKIGNMLNAELLAAGTVQKTGRQIMVTVHLISARTAEVKFSVTHSANPDCLESIFALGGNIAGQIEFFLFPDSADRPKAREDIRPTRSLDAFILYSRGLQDFDGGYHSRGLGAMKQASDIDPDFDWAAAIRNRAESVFRELEMEMRENR